MKMSSRFLRACLLALLLCGSGAAFAVTGVAVTPATGGTGISLDTNGTNGTGVYTPLTGPIMTENNPGGVTSTGTMIFNAPTGFEFSTAANSVTVTITPKPGKTCDAAKGILVGTGTTSQTVTPTASSFTIDINRKSSPPDQCELTFSGIQIRPIDNTATSGTITRSGTVPPSENPPLTPGVDYGQISTTPASLPTVTTSTATNLSATGATLNGTGTSNGSSTTVTFEYGTASGVYTSTATAAQSPLASTASGTPVSAVVSGLNCGTQYYFRTKGVNVIGTAYGSELNFTTSACPLPTVTTQAATSITSAGATLNGTINDNGADTTVTFEYGTTSGVYGAPVAATPATVTAGSGATAVATTLSGLSCGTTYYFRVNGTSSSGTANGSELSFTTTACSAPTVTTNAASAVTDTSATLNGTVSSNGSSTTVTFDYGLTTAYGNTATAAQSPLAAGASGAAVSAAIASLTCGTTYHFRVTATNAVGTTNGGDLTFTTASCAITPPTVTTDAATALTTTGATLNGTVSSNGASTTVTFDYGLTTAYGTTATATQSPLAAGASGAAVSAAVTGLTCGTLYHFRVTGTNSAGTTNGGDLTFTTTACSLPTATTSAATAITVSGATLNGTINDNGADTTVTFEYGTTSGVYGAPVAATPGTVNAGSGNTAVTATLSGLSCGTTYYFRVNGTNSVGTTNGSELTFTTSVCVPPNVLSINIASANPAAPSSLVSWTVTFDQGVAGVDATDFQLVYTGSAGPASITSVANSTGGSTIDSIWTVTVDTGTGTSGTEGLNLVDDDTIVNASNAPLGGTGAGNGNFTGQTYTIVLNTAGFVFTSSACTDGVAFGTAGQCTLMSWSPQVAGIDVTGIYITNVNSSGVPTRLHPAQPRTLNLDFGLSCHDPVSNAGMQATFTDAITPANTVTLPLCQSNGAQPTIWSATLPVTFPGGVPSAGPYTFNYPDVGSVEFWAQDSAATTSLGTSNAFVVAPDHFGISGVTAAPIKAGNNFSATVTAYNGLATPTATANFGQETSPESATLTFTKCQPTGASAVNGAFSGTAGAFAAGSATAANLNWSEVGNGDLTATLTSGNYLSSGLSATGNTGTGGVVCNGGGAGNVGAFVPDHFDTTVSLTAGVPMPCPSGLTCPTLYNGFVYSGQTFTVNIYARNAAGAVTQNYDGTANTTPNFAKAVTLSAWDALGSTTTQNPPSGSDILGNNAVPAASFASGTTTLGTPATPAYTFNTTPTAPTDIYLRATDTDGVTSLRSPAASSGEDGVKVVSGRIKISNAYGSELLPLPIAVTAQYYDGAGYVTSNTDSISNFSSAATPAGNVSFSNCQALRSGGVALSYCPPATAPTPASVTFNSGTGSFTLSAPGSSNTGSVDMSITGISYLPSTTARATFGVYSNNSNIIYMREVY